MASGCPTRDFVLVSIFSGHPIPGNLFLVLGWDHLSAVVRYPISNTSQSFPFFRTFAMQLFHPFGIRVLPSPSPLSAYCHKHVKMRIARPILPNTHNARYRLIQPTQTLMSRRLNQALSSRLSSLLHCPHCPLEFSNGLRV